jgi:hypothetical protein
MLTERLDQFTRRHDGQSIILSVEAVYCISMSILMLSILAAAKFQRRRRFLSQNLSVYIIRSLIVGLCWLLRGLNLPAG